MPTTVTLTLAGPVGPLFRVQVTAVVVEPVTVQAVVPMTTVLSASVLEKPVPLMTTDAPTDPEQKTKIVDENF